MKKKHVDAALLEEQYKLYQDSAPILFEKTKNIQHSTLFPLIVELEKDLYKDIPKIDIDAAFDARVTEVMKLPWIAG